MTNYFKITERELTVLMDISDSMDGMSGSGNKDFDNEADRGKKAIDSILKRHGLKRDSNKYSDVEVKI